MKKWMHWIGFAILLGLGIVICLKNILPVKNVTVFLLGLYALWQGIVWFAGLGVGSIQRYSRKAQLIFAALYSGLGLTWLCISLSLLSERALPMILVSLPFLLSMLVLKLRHQREENSES